MRAECIEFTKKQLKKAIGIDQVIIQCSASIDDVEETINKLSKRLRDWYELYFPELSNIIKDNEEFVKEISKSKKELMNKFNLESVGRDEDRSFEHLRSEIEDLFNLKIVLENKLDELVKTNLPKTYDVCGPIVAKLLRHAGSLNELSKMPSSTVQILGAEKALFRHLKTGKNPPKYGILLSHPLVAEAKNKGKAASKLADKISIATKVDYFR